MSSFVAKQGVLQILSIDNLVFHYLLLEHFDFVFAEHIAQHAQILVQHFPTTLVLLVQHIDSRVHFLKRSLVIP